MKTHFNRPAFEEIHNRCLSLGERKCHDYGAAGDGIGMAGVRGVVVRNLDKQLRCMSLTEPGHISAVNDESLKDTLMDMINYATYAVALLEGTWGQEPNPMAFRHPEEMARKAIMACEAVDEYLRENDLNQIGAGSRLHMQVKNAVSPVRTALDDGLPL